MLTLAVVRTVGYCTRHPWIVILVAAGLAIGSAFYVAVEMKEIEA